MFKQEKTYPLIDHVSMEKLLKLPRNSGGHTEILNNLFIDGEVIASVVQNDYQGEEVYIYHLQDGHFVVVTDSFGSCSGCDSWEDCSDFDVPRLIQAILNNAITLPDMTNLLRFLIDAASDSATYYFISESAPELAEQLEQHMVYNNLLSALKGTKKPY